MTDQISAPVLLKPIPPQVINEGAAYGPFNLNEFIQSPNTESGDTYFFAEMIDGSSLPKGLICTGDGLISGIPAPGTHGDHKIRVIVENDSGVPCIAEIDFLIKERTLLDSQEQLLQNVNLKSKVWEALKQNLPIPELSDLLNRDITAIEIYYLLQRFATLTIWDVYNLDAPSEKKVLDIKGLNEHYVLYDRGSCLVAAPKELYSHKRGLEHALQASRYLAQEAYNRGWVIEFAGFDKMVRAAWVELRMLGDKHGKMIEILHYTPSTSDLRIYEMKSNNRSFGLSR